MTEFSAFAPGHLMHSPVSPSVKHPNHHITQNHFNKRDKQTDCPTKVDNRIDTFVRRAEFLPVDHEKKIKTSLYLTLTGGE